MRPILHCVHSWDGRRELVAWDLVLRRRLDLPGRSEKVVLDYFIGRCWRGLLLICAGASLLAPPAIYLLDGPGLSPPPLAVTLVTTYFAVTLEADEKPPELPKIVPLADIAVSFVGLPFLVVFFWRGTWLLLDEYFWGVTDEHELKVSLGWGTLFSFVCFVLTSEPVISFIQIDHKLGAGVIGRVRTYILAWGTVSFWRVVWDIWDLYMGGVTTWSSWISHAVGVVYLTAMGCVSSINAPASTLGVDVVPHPGCADEPLFSMIPIPWELLYFFGIGRQALKAEIEPSSEVEPTSEVELSSVTDEEEKKEKQQEDTSSKRFELRSSIRSWRPGLGTRGKTSFYELHRPGLSERARSEYQPQRPGIENSQRYRSKYFRNR